jgi:hypothetical protein
VSAILRSGSNIVITGTDGEVTTSIGFGGGEVIEVDLPLAEVRSVLQAALEKKELVELRALSGEPVIINPAQVKVLQNSGAPEPFPMALPHGDT